MTRIRILGVSFGPSQPPPSPDLPRQKKDNPKEDKKKYGSLGAGPPRAYAEDVTTNFRISWEDEKRILRHINFHAAQAAELLKFQCFSDTHIMAIVAAIRGGCEAAVLFVSRCHLIKTEQDRVREVEKACADVKAAIESACARVPTRSVIHVTDAVSRAINGAVTSGLPKKTACSDYRAYRIQYIAQTRMFTVVHSTVMEQMAKHFGPAPGVGFLDERRR